MTRIVFVLTYPTYHSVADPAEWLRWDNRDRRMPALLSAMGVDVELWGVAREAEELTSDAAFGAPYRVRLFAQSGGGRKSRDHWSDDMVAAARAEDVDLFVLIGTNGGAGYRLYDRALRPLGKRYAVIIGGDYFSRLVPGAAIVFTESTVQERALTHPGRWAWLWRRAVPAERLERLPKTIDTQLFSPQAAEREWDVLSISRLTRWKSFEEVGVLSERQRVAVAGGGDRAAALTKRYPAIRWLGHVRHGEVPVLLARAGLYFHAGRRDYFPRAIVEAMACGKPVVGFADRLGEDVIPPDCGLRVTETSYRPLVTALLGDPARMAQMAAAARAHVVATHGPRSSEAACRKLVRVAEGGR